MMPGICRTAMINSNKGQLNSDYDFSMLRKWALGNKGGLMNKSDFIFDKENGRLSAGSEIAEAVILCKRPTSYPLANQTFLAQFQFSGEIDNLPTAEGTKIFIEIKENLILDPTLIQDSEGESNYAKGFGIGEIKAAQSWPTHENYLKLYEIQGEELVDLRKAISLPALDEVAQRTDSLEEKMINAEGKIEKLENGGQTNFVVERELKQDIPAGKAYQISGPIEWIGPVRGTALIEKGLPPYITLKNLYRGEYNETNESNFFPALKKVWIKGTSYYGATYTYAKKADGSEIKFGPSSSLPGDSNPKEQFYELDSKTKYVKFRTTNNSYSENNIAYFDYYRNWDEVGKEGNNRILNLEYPLVRFRFQKVGNPGNLTIRCNGRDEVIANSKTYALDGEHRDIYSFYNPIELIASNNNSTNYWIVHYEVSESVGEGKILAKTRVDGIEKKGGTAGQRTYGIEKGLIEMQGKADGEYFLGENGELLKDSGDVPIGTIVGGYLKFGEWKKKLFKLDKVHSSKTDGVWEAPSDGILIFQLNRREQSPSNDGYINDINLNEIQLTGGIGMVYVSKGNVTLRTTTVSYYSEYTATIKLKYFIPL